MEKLITVIILIYRLKLSYVLLITKNTKYIYIFGINYKILIDK